MLCDAYSIGCRKYVDSASGEIAALEKAESELVDIEKEMDSAEKVSFLLVNT